MNDDERARRILDNLGVEPHYGALVVVRGALHDLQKELGAAYQKAGAVCEIRLECGATCYLPQYHTGPCLCTGDTDGPGSCPA